jgi:hypothetical protein
MMPHPYVETSWLNGRAPARAKLRDLAAKPSGKSVMPLTADTGTPTLAETMLDQVAPRSD